jgi:acetone carboxylase gamma subunit
MSTFRCRCGKTFADTEIPCAYEYSLVPDTAFERLTEAIIQACQPRNDAEAQVPFLLSSAGIPVYRCPHCGRLLVFWDGLQRVPLFYQPELSEGRSSSSETSRAGEGANRV